MSNATETETESFGRGRVERDDHPLLTIVHHPDPDLVGAHQPLTRGRHVVGREGGTLFPGAFHNKKVSREHAAFSAERGVVKVVDLDSRNGTHVNGAPATEVTLAPGDVIRIGGIVLLHHLGPRHHAEPSHPFMAGTSHVLARLLDELKEAAGTSQSVMLVGETGVGKELAARTVHEASGRSGAFVPLNCGGMAEGVIQSELFGHSRGAFSGAAAARPGLVQEAEGGTLFLDEVGAAPMALQTTLLRLLETNDFRVVGDAQLRRANVRFVAATQPDVETQMEDGSFRRDLWYRLAHRIVRIPPLRERRQDIPAIIARHCIDGGRPPLRLSAELAALMIRHHWPGNVRELLATIDRLASAADGDELFVPRWLEQEVARQPAPRGDDDKVPTKRPDREELLAALVQHRASIAATAKALGVDRKSLYRWLKALDIDIDALRAKHG